MQMNRYYTVGIVEDEVIERQALRMIMEEKGQSCRLFLKPKMETVR